MSARLEQILHRSLRLAVADRRGLISVAGPQALDAMIGLCRIGFDHVECARQATCSSADDASDVLLITGRQSPAQLAEVIRRTCRLLREGGALVAELQHPGDDVVVRAALAGRGLAPATSAFDMSVGCLVGHRIERAERLSQAS